MGTTYNDLGDRLVAKEVRIINISAPQVKQMQHRRTVRHSTGHPLVG